MAQARILAARKGGGSEKEWKEKRRSFILKNGMGGTQNHFAARQHRQCEGVKSLV